MAGRKSKSPLGCLGVFLLLFGGVFAGFGGWGTWQEYRANRDFREVSATVVAAEVEAHSDSDGTTYSPKITFEYEAGGRKFTSDKYRITGESRSGGWAERIVKGYRKGQSVTAYYDPADPKTAVLLLGYSVLPPVFGGIGLAVFVAALVMLGVWLSRRLRGGVTASAPRARSPMRCGASGSAGSTSPRPATRPAPCAASGSPGG